MNQISDGVGKRSYKRGTRLVRGTINQATPYACLDYSAAEIQKSLVEIELEHMLDVIVRSLQRFCAYAEYIDS